MTMQDAQEQVAKDYGYATWFDIDPTNVSMDEVWRNVATLYTETKIKEIDSVVHGYLSDEMKVARIKELLS